MGCLYQISFPNGKSYIGISSATAKGRFDAHCLPSNTAIVGRAIKKYGKDAAQLKTLAIASNWEYLCELERKAITIYKARSPFGYNMTDGGDGTLGLRHSEAAKKTISEKNKLSMRGNKNFAGHKLSPEHRAKLLAVNLGKPKSDEVKAKLSAKNKGRKHTAEATAKIAAAGLGRTQSDYAKACISVARKGKPLSTEHRAKLSAAHIGKISGNKGVTWSATTRAKHEARHTKAKEAA